MIRLLRLALLLLALAPAAVAAQTQEDTFKQLVDEALEHYRAKHYDQAITNFEGAYRIRPEPELIYNIARSYEKGLRRQEAIDAYNRFLSLPGTTAELRANALDALDALKKEQAAMNKKAEPPPTPRVTEPGRGPAATEGPNTQLRAPAKPPERSHVLEYAITGVGAAAVVTGAVFGVLALDANSKFEDAKTQARPRTELEDLRQDVKDRALIADVCIIGGAVVAGVGVGLLLFSGDSGDTEVAVTPVLRSDAAAISFSGRF